LIKKIIGLADGLTKLQYLIANTWFG